MPLSVCCARVWIGKTSVERAAARALVRIMFAISKLGLSELFTMSARVVLIPWYLFISSTNRTNW